MKNVLFITADQWRGDCLSAMNHPHVQTPNLDQLAQDGVLFENHYTQTTPCGPARASLYTGMYLQNHRSVNNGTPLDARHTNFALEARKLGYNPALFGYTDVTPDPRTLPPGDPALRTYEGILPGLHPELFLDGEELRWRAFLQEKGYEIPRDPLALHGSVAHFPGAAQRGPTFAPPCYKAEHSLTAFLTDELIKYIGLRQEQPWFVHASYLRPHPPWSASAPYHEMYDPHELALPVKAETRQKEAAQHPWLACFLEHGQTLHSALWHGQNPKIPLTAEAIQQVRATYYGLISEVDSHIGRLVGFLKKSGLYDQTLIVFTTDHGEQLGDHWMFGKWGYFDQAFHIPLIIRDPEAQDSPTRRVQAFSEAVDVMPTLLDWLGLEIPLQCDGQSLLPYCKGSQPKNERTEAHWEYDFRNLRNPIFQQALGLRSHECVLNVIRDHRYKYVHFAALPSLLFDLQADPSELQNFAGDPSHTSVLLEYAQKLLNWRMGHDEQVLSNVWVGKEGAVSGKK